MSPAYSVDTLSRSADGVKDSGCKWRAIIFRSLLIQVSGIDIESPMLPGYALQKRSTVRTLVPEVAT